MIKRCLAVCVLVSIIFTGCYGNRDILDDVLPSSNIWKYAIVEVGGKTYEGEIKSWADYVNSDALKIVFKDGTEVMTSYNKAVLSKNKIEWK